MTKLTEKERETFEKILKQDLDAIDTRFMNQVKDFWDISRKCVAKSRGWDKLQQEKVDLERQRLSIAQRIHEIESLMAKEDLRVEQIVELGGKVNDYGKARGAHFYGIPVESQFDYEIVEYIRQNIDIEVPAKILRDVCEASIRALAMSGTFEEARAAYEKFYSLDFRKFGVDIPPRLEDLCADKKLLSIAQTSLQPSQQIADVKSVPKLESGKDVV